jgi:hypothetical protein
MGLLGLGGYISQCTLSKRKACGLGPIAHRLGGGVPCIINNPDNASSYQKYSISGAS